MKSKGMGYMRRARKRDANEPEIIAILEYVGCQVYPLDKPLDLLVGHFHKTFLIEVKNPTTEKIKRSRSVTDDQKEFFKEWKGGPAKIVRTQFEALFVIGYSAEDATVLVERFKKRE